MMPRRLLALLLLLSVLSSALAQTNAGLHNQQMDEWLITNAMIIAGVGTPAEGPYDIHIKDGKIEALRAASGLNSLRDSIATQLDASGKTVLPGFINMHAHIMHSRAGIDMAQPYQYYLWLSSGITSVRDVGSNLDRTLEDRQRSAAHEIIAPRIYVYPGTWGNYRDEDVIERIRDLKKRGVDGLKFGMMDRHTFETASAEARRLELPVANHVGVEDMTAWQNVEQGTTTIEHWYGVPDAALNGTQRFPADMNYSNELHRFRYAGRLWRETDAEKLDQVLKAMASAGVAWDPTLVIYEASRDLQRATTSPWYGDYLHPGLEKFFQPSPDAHGSFFWGWTATDEVYWRDNYQRWFAALRAFKDHGGIITTGEDAGFIYQVFGFGYLRELQLHEEAGFQPLEVITHATHNSAKVLGMGESLGQVRIGYVADLVIVNGNPLEDLRVLMPRNIPTLTGDETTGGIEWTIKDGIPYHAPTMLAAVREMVTQSRAENPINYLVPASR